MGPKDPSRNMVPPVENPSVEEEIQENGDQEKGEETDQKKEKGRFRALCISMTPRKWVMYAGVGLLFLCMGLGITYGKKFIPSSLVNSKALPSEKGHTPDYYEETLPSFIIPLPPEGEDQAVLICFSVIWDGLTSFRYRSLELPIRNRIYGHIKGIAKEENNLQEKTPLLESELSKILRESLGLNDLAVKVKEVKVL